MAVTKPEAQAAEILAAVNRITVKAFSAANRQSLIFVILNDTFQAVPYDRAVLFGIDGDHIKLMGVSGNVSVSSHTELAEDWKLLVRDLKDKDKPQTLSIDRFNEQKDLWQKTQNASPSTSYLWVPIIVQGRLRLGLWLERWSGKAWSDEEMGILNSLSEAFGLAYRPYIFRFAYKSSVQQSLSYLVGLSLLILMFLIRVPLRIVAPCEVSPKDPIIVTAPLEGVIESVLVHPGQVINKDDLVFQYDQRIPQQELKVAEAKLQISQSEADRATTLGLQDPKSRTELAVLALKLKREQLDYELAKYKASRLLVTAPIGGIAVFDVKPEDWRGQPVHVGERVLSISDPQKTRVTIMIPEADNISVDTSQPVRIFLDSIPDKTFEAVLTYVASKSTVSQAGVPSFEAEADWAKGQPEGIRIGLRGTAVLYGPEVSLVYWLFRKPWAAIRKGLGT